jgi:hypothetical protein
MPQGRAVIGRRPNERRLQELLDYVKAHPGESDREVARGIDPQASWWTPSRTQDRIRQLRRRGLLHPTRNEFIQTELWSYLLLDVPADSREAVTQTIEQHAPGAEQIDADGVYDLDCNLLVRTRRLLDADSVVLLCRRAVDAGAKSARGLKFLAAS